MQARGDIYPWTRMPRSLDKDTPFGRAVVPPSRAKSPGGAGSVTAGELVAASTNIVRVEVWYSSRHQRRAAVAKGVEIEIAPLDEEHVRAKITWSEQDVGGGKLVVEVTVKNMKTHPKTDEQLRSDAKALAVRFARAFADTIEN